MASLYITGEGLEAASYYSPSFASRNQVDGLHALALFDPDGAQAGTFVVPGSIATKLASGSYDCIQIPRTDSSTAHLESTERIPFSTCFGSKSIVRYTKEQWEQVEILVVQWDDKHEVATRLGAGVCHATAFGNCIDYSWEVCLKWTSRFICINSFATLSTHELAHCY